MERIDETYDRVEKMMKESGIDVLDLIVAAEDGDDIGVVLDSGDEVAVVGGTKTWMNYEVTELYPDLTANTKNHGKIDLRKDCTDEDDAYTIEDIVKDLI